MKKYQTSAPSTSTTNHRGWYTLAILAAFALSGAAGLVHEVTWTRLLRLVMGSTTYSIATVLAVFMGGLALGGYFGGRLADRRRDPLRTFAVLEAVVAVYCLFLPWLIDAVEPLYRVAYRAELGFAGLNLLRFVLCALLLLPPATLMGATLPTLTRWVVQSAGETGRRVGRLYAVNTLGAAVGAGATSFLLVPVLGLQTTIYVGVAGNLIAAAIAWWLHIRVGLSPATDSSNPGDTPSTAHQDAADEGTAYGGLAIRLLLVGYALSGFAAMVFQIAWTRVLTLSIGSSVYAFGLILTAFIIGLGLGALVYSPFCDRVRAPLARLGLIQVAIGLSALCVVPVFAWLPFYLTKVIAETGTAFWRLQALEFGLILAITLVPTLLMGAAFPLVTKTYARRAAGVSRSVGTVYMFNTVGAILGSLFGGFALIPLLGIQHTLYAAIALSVVIGLVYILLDPHRTPQRRLAVSGLAVAVGVGLASMIPTWNPARIGLAPFVNATSLGTEIAGSRDKLEEIVHLHKTIYYHEGVSATVMVRQNQQGVLQLLTNGRVEASSHGSALQQRMLAHIPLLLHPAPTEALVVGLASGITLDAAAQHPLQAVDCVELSAGVVEATRYFDDVNQNVLDDPRVNMILSDGRNHLTLTDRKYDVIISQPSDPATAGVASLFTQEFFEACYDRLNDRGLACVWLKGSTVELDVFRSIVGTFGDTFDDVSIWSVTGGFSEYMLVGSRGRKQIELDTLVQRIRGEELSTELQPLGINTAADFLTYRLASRDGAAAFAGDSPHHTDDHPRLEFTAPQTALGKPSTDSIVDAIFASQNLSPGVLAPPTTPDQTQLHSTLHRVTTSALNARHTSDRARRALAEGDVTRGVELLAEAAKLNPNDRIVRTGLNQLRQRLDQALVTKNYAAAIQTARHITQILPQSESDRLRLEALLRQHGPAQQTGR